GGNSTLQELGLQRAQGCVRGEHVVEHHLVVYESEGELPRFLEQIVQKQKTLLNGALDALMLDRKHHGRLERHLQSAGETQSERLDLLVIRHGKSLLKQIGARHHANVAFASMEGQPQGGKVTIVLVVLNPVYRSFCPVFEHRGDLY